MFRIDSLKYISDDSLQDSEKTIKTLKSTKTKDETSRGSLLRKQSTKNLASRNTIKIIPDNIFKQKKVDKTSTSSSQLGKQQSIKEELRKRSLSPDVTHRKSFRVVDITPIKSRTSLKQSTNISPKGIQKIPSIATFARRSTKEKTGVVNISNLVNQLKNKESEKNNDIQNDTSSLSSGSTQPHSSIKKLLSQDMNEPDQQKQNMPVIPKEIGNIEAYSYKNEYITTELEEIANKLMRGQSEQVKISHQPLLKYVCQFNKNKSMIRKSLGLTDQTEQMQLILRIIQYIGNQDTLFKKAIKLIHKELGQYLVPTDQSDLARFQKYTHALYQLNTDEEQPPYVQYSNYKQIADVLLKGVQYYEKQNYMSFSNLIEQKQTYNQLSEFHNKQLELEWAEKEQLQYKEKHFEELIEQRVKERELKYKEQAEKILESCNLKIKLIQEECQKRIGEYIKETRQHQEIAALMQEKYKIIENQIQDIKEKIQRRRYNVLFQQIMDTTKTSFHQDCSIQCNMSIDAPRSYQNVIKVKYDGNLHQRPLSPNSSLSPSSSQIISSRRFSRHLQLNTNNLQQ